MRPRDRSGFVRLSLLLGLATAALVVACSDLPPVSGGDGADAAGEGEPPDALFDLSGADAGPDGSAPCTSSSECGGGVCMNGLCCATAAAVCGASCCAGGTVCLFGACVTPGKVCSTTRDCAAGEYCETALGGPGAAPDAGSADGAIACSAPPRPGRCLAQPAVCADTDGGSPDGCVARCEYHPTVGNLNARVEWSWGANAVTKPNFIDVWATPAVGRVVDGNCDGKTDELDAPNVVFVSGKSIDATTGKGTCCQCTNTTPTACLTGVLRMLDGRTGEEVWALASPGAGSSGFAGLSVALGDLDGDGALEVAAVTGEGKVVIVDASGKVVRTSDKPIPGATNATFGWGGGLAIADMDGDGAPEIAYASTVFSTAGGALTLKFTGAGGLGGGGVHEALSTFADLDGAADGNLELLAGRAAFRADGSTLWARADLTDGFDAVADLDADGKPDVVLVTGGKVYVLDAATGVSKYPVFALPGNGFGGPPTIADFDGDKKPEIGVAQQNFYTVLKPDLAAKTLGTLWSKPNHDLSSSVTGSSVFDFEGDGRAEVIYNDECFLWVFDGVTGAVRFAASTTSFTATEASVVADVDGDGRAEILMIANSADPSSAGWRCLDAAGSPTTVNGVTWTPGPALGKSYRGVTAFGDAANAWVGTRTLWNEHTYHVSNVCDDRDSACAAPNRYGAIPKRERKNWTLGWLDNFRQNVQDKGLFDAPNATVSVQPQCTSPAKLVASLRNEGLASLPAGVEVALYVWSGASKTELGRVTSTQTLFPGQTEQLTFAVDPGKGTSSSTYSASVVVDAANPKFRQCRADDDESPQVRANCPQ